MKDNIIIEIQNLNKQYSNSIGTLTIFDGFELSLFKDQITSIVGPSGCGKTSLLNIISELDNDYSGKIQKNIQNMVGYIFQEDALIPWKTVYENIVLGLSLKNGDSQDVGYYETLLKGYGLYEYRDYYPKMLSGGMRQKVALAQMLINDLDLILLDEPFSSQDFFTKIQLENMFYENIKQKQLSAVLVTHDIEEAVALSDRIIVLSQKPCKILKDISLDFRQQEERVLPEQVREMTSISSYFADIYQTLKPELT